MKGSPIHVLVFVSEILSAKTLIPIMEVMRQEPGFSMTIVNDGFCMEFIQTLELPVEYILDDFESRIDGKIQAASVVLMGKSYVQPSEYAILLAAARRGVPVLMVVPDMGIDVVRAKLRCFGGQVPYPTLLLADERTRTSLKVLNVPEERIVEFGNPYFDDLYHHLLMDQSEWNPEGIGYFSTPFELDFDRGILPADYRQKDLIEDVREVARKLRQPLTGKRHPQVDPALFGGMRVFDGTPLEMIRQIRVAVGSYSTTLLEAFAAGIPTFSYQPWEANIRQDVFENRIPIVKTPSELLKALSGALEQPPRRRPPAHVTFNAGHSLMSVLGLIRENALPA